jgi:competence protein ComEC
VASPYWILAAFAAGIALTTRLPAAGPAPLIIAAASLLLWLGLRRGRWATVPLTAALLLAGFLWAHHALAPPVRSDHVWRLAGPDIHTLTGRVHQAEHLWDGTSRLDVAVERVGSGGAAAPASGLVRLSVREGGDGIWPGSLVAWQGRLRRPRLYGTPGEFDYPRHLAARGIFVTSFVERGTDVAVHADPATTGHWCARARLAIARRIARAVPGEHAGLLQTLIVGVGGGIAPEQRRLLSDGGLAHLFSISGLHFSLLAVLAYAIGSWLYRRSERLLLLAPPKRVLPLLLLIPLYGYLLLSGNAAPTRRSFGMIALAALLFSWHRRTPPLALLAAVACGMLVLSPLALFDPSFQLSMAGVAGLMTWLPAWKPRLDVVPAWQRGFALLAMTTVAATLATSPIVLWHFHQFAPAGLVTNLVAVPLITWGAVPAGLAGALLLPVAPWLSDPCFVLAGKVVDLTAALTAGCLALPPLQAIIRPVTWLAGLAALLLTGSLLPALGGPRRLLLAGTALLLLLIPAADGGRLRVTALSVGQGDATLLSVAGRHYLVDGGGLTGSTVDIGERLVAPALGRLGATRLSGVILTHDHPDHSAGLSYVVEQLSVAVFWSALPPERLDPRLAAALRDRRVPVVTLPEGWTPVACGAGASLAIYVPPQEAEDPNDRSLVVHAAAGDAGVLLTADLAVEGFEHLAAAGVPEPVTLLKLPHHGSRGSRPERFLDRWPPQLAFLSAGRDNSYGLPHPTSLAACRERGIPLYRTDLQGTLTFSSDGGPWSVRCHHPGD